MLFDSCLQLLWWYWAPELAVYIVSLLIPGILFWSKIKQSSSAGFPIAHLSGCLYRERTLLSQLGDAQLGEMDGKAADSLTPVARKLELLLWKQATPYLGGVVLTEDQEKAV